MVMGVTIAAAGAAPTECAEMVMGVAIASAGAWERKGGGVSGWGVLISEAGFSIGSGTTEISCDADSEAGASREGLAVKKEASGIGEGGTSCTHARVSLSEEGRGAGLLRTGHSTAGSMALRILQSSQQWVSLVRRLAGGIDESPGWRFAALFDEKPDATDPAWVLRVMDPDNVLYEERVSRAKFDAMKDRDLPWRNWFNNMLAARNNETTVARRSGKEGARMIALTFSYRKDRNGVI
ncbi:hypothetical protein T484DRAFT_1782796 [Baffinella frigidus]|nr:hypothetical protein T484DRAFT_1782796 [Cryptophyta sp. CCMP2293]